MEDLVRTDDKGELVPRLVETVPTLENGLARIAADEAAPSGRLEVTFVLRTGLFWHDGQPITSDDIRFAWERDRLAARGTSARADADLVERVDVVNSRAAIVVLRAGVRTSRYATLAHAMPRHLLESARADAVASYERSPVHAGPFSIASWQAGIGATLVPFARYALGKPQLTRIDVRFYRDADAVVAALRGGEVELAPAGIVTADVGQSLERFAESKGLVVRYTPQVWGDLLLFNFRTAYGDSRVRRAVAMAIDRRAINQQVFGGRARVPTSYLLAPLWAAADSAAPPDTDVAAAANALAAAGYCVTCATGRASQQLRARIAVQGGSLPRIAAATLVAHDLRAVGAVASVTVYEERAFADALASGDFDLAVASRGGADPADATEEYTSTSPRNVTGYADPAFDALARSASGYVTRAERRPLYVELQRIWSSGLPGLPLYQELAVDIVPAGLDAIAPSPWHGPLSWNAYAWHFIAQ
jgi:peptide/nickel transport system substrate-binding protein